MFVRDPMVGRIYDICDCLKLVGVVLGVGTVIVAASPVAMAVSLIALPILGVQYWMDSRNHQFILNKTIEVYGVNRRERTGPTIEKNYMENIPKQLDTHAWGDRGSKFNTVRDLSWLWYEYHRLIAEKKMEVTLKRIKFWAYLLIPVGGICHHGLKQFERDSAYNPGGSGITPKKAVEAHFLSLRDKFQIHGLAIDSLSCPNNKYYSSIVNTVLNRSNELEDPGIPKDLPVDQFFRI